MKILFLVRHFSYLRNFESAISLLASRGHAVHVSADREENLGGKEMVERLASQSDSITVGRTPRRVAGAWDDLAVRLRLGVDYIRFLAPRYDDTVWLRQRARTRAPLPIVLLMKFRPMRGRLGRRLSSRFLRFLESGLPQDEAIYRFIHDQSPDVTLITPLVDLGSPQVEHLSSAKAQGLRTMLCVGSWDHLSSKSLLRQIPDRVTVWNEIQKREAVELHGVPSDRVVVTGAQCYDQWFGRRPTRSRKEFCDRVGLDSDKAFVTYVCSSLFRGTANEARFVEEWVQRIRSSKDPSLKNIGILIRPHPARIDEWQGSEISAFRDVVMWGSHPVDRVGKEDYFDSLYHCVAVIGLNTSALLEAAVVGRPVHTVILPEISRANQEGTIHFHYLLSVNGGLLHVGRTFDAHLELLSKSVGGARSERSRLFVEGFIRPFGVDESSTPRFVDAIEELARQPVPERIGSPWFWRIARSFLYPWVLLLFANVQTRHWRKDVRYRFRRGLRNRKKRFWLRLRHAAASHLKAWDKDIQKDYPSNSPLMPKLGRKRQPAKELVGQNFPEALEIKERVTRLGRSKRTVVVGPWLSETGFELLYWIPFVAWAKAYANMADARLVVVSRGGVGSWYRHITTNYQDILSLYTPNEFRERNEERILSQRGKLKHLEITDLDREIVSRVGFTIGDSDVEMLHPWMMYRLFDRFWRQEAPMTLVEAFTSYQTLPPVGPGDILTHLPDDYVAAKFYANSALPDTEANRAFINVVLDNLVQAQDVVLLNTPDRYDDHMDFAPSVRNRLHRIDHLMTPMNNLDIQTRVISGAKAFVGTYGGFSYLAPLSRVGAVAYYSHPTGFRFDHLEIAQRVFSSLDGGSFVPLHVKDTEMLRYGVGSKESSIKVPFGPVE